MSDETYLPGFQVGNQAVFDEGDGEHTRSLGVVVRAWPNRRFVTLRSEGRTFVRDIRSVEFCDHRGHESDNVNGHPHPLVCLTCSGPEGEDPEVEFFVFDAPSEGSS